MSRKGLNIYKRKDGRWEGRYIKTRSEEGKAIYGYVYAKTYRETKEKLNHISNLKSVLVEDNQDLRGIINFYEVTKKWFKSVETNLKQSSRNKYQNMLDMYIIPTLGEMLLNQITYEVLQQLCNKLLATGGSRGQGLSTKTVSDILALTSEILHYASKDYPLVPLDIHSIKIKQKLREMRVLSRDEQNRLCEYLYGNLNSYNIGILVCLFTGMRVGEICALRWEDISLGEQTIYVHQTLQRIQDKSNRAETKTKIIVTPPKSTCSIRYIPLPNELVEIITPHKTAEKGYFLTNNEHKYIEPRNMQYHFKKILKKCNINHVNYHVLRHTFATRCIELGFDVKSLSEILGHASVNITMNRYVHPSMELKKENMQRLSELFTVK